MSSTIDRQQLETLLETLTPEEIYRRHGNDLDEECRALWPDLMAFDQELEALSGNLTRLSPPPPEHARPLVVIPWWRRSLAMPAWSVPLMAAAILLLAYLPNQRGSESEVLLPVETTRSSNLKNDVELLILDEKVHEALMERGLYFFDKGDAESFAHAMVDFEKAFAINPDDDRPLNYLEIMAEALQDKQGIARYRAWRKDFEIRRDGSR